MVALKNLLALLFFAFTTNAFACDSALAKRVLSKISEASGETQFFKPIANAQSYGLEGSEFLPLYETSRLIIGRSGLGQRYDFVLKSAPDRSVGYVTFTDDGMQFESALDYFHLYTYIIKPKRNGGKGYMTEAKFVLLNHFFKATTHTQSSARIKPENTASIRLHTKLGYKFSYFNGVENFYNLSKEDFLKLKAKVTESPEAWTKFIEPSSKP